MKSPVSGEIATPREQETGARLLDPRLLARLEALQLGTRRRLAGHFAGEHRSTRRGSSPDFADYRQYHPGDDFRRIDYFLYARLDVLLLKLYEAEDDLHLRLLVDTSASMATGGKLDMARRVAAALGFVALTRRDPVSVHTFPLQRAAPRFAGRAAVPALFAPPRVARSHRRHRLRRRGVVAPGPARTGRAHRRRLRPAHRGVGGRVRAGCRRGAAT